MEYQDFLQFADKLPEGMLLLTSQGQILAINRMATQILQKHPQELLNQSLSQLTNVPEAELAERLRPCTRSRTPVQVALKFTDDPDTAQATQASGFLFTPATDSVPAQIVLRVKKSRSSLSQFHALNEEIEKQHRIMRLLMESRDTLRVNEQRLATTLQSIGDAVISTDIDGRVQYMNPVAEGLTGWMQAEAAGKDLEDVFNIVNEATRIKSENPVVLCLREGRVIGLANHTILVRRDGTDVAIEDSAAPIRTGSGEVTGVVLVFHDVTLARRLAAEMSHQATHDALTDLVNRREFERRMHNAIQGVHERSTEHALLCIDLDQFKVINDTCGHVAGDELLRQVSSILHQPLRDGDTLARLGGDEFGVLLENCPLDKASELAESICVAVKEFRFVWEEQPFNIGTSIGVVPINQGTERLSDAMSAADLACYTAKESGRNRIHIADPNDLELSARKGEMRWLGLLRTALVENHFLVYFQRICAIDDEETVEHAEVLLRLKDGDSIIPPGAFIPAAERYNLMPDLDRWMINAVFKKYHDDQLSGNAPGQGYAINLCGLSMSDHRLIDYILEQQNRYHVPSQKICFEITETAAIANLSHATKFIKSLKAVGFTFALDDFGSGMSSFAYLKNLPVDYLKIDGTFVQDIESDPIDFAMVKSINEIGHAMGIKTIAEFVENEGVLGKLKQIGVDFVQGYHVHRPQPI